MKVPFLDLKGQYHTINKEIEKGLSEVMLNTAFASGPFAEKFEREYAEFCGTKHCTSVNSGTSALHVALLAHGIQNGDEVITVPNSFIATSWAITYCGAKPVFVDVDPETYLINCDLIEEAITPKTKAILPVHLYGQPLEIRRINEIAEKHNLIIIEDAAQAHAATYEGEHIGNHGNTTCFSFYPGKNLGAYGEGGAVITNEKKIADRIKMLRDHGQTKKYHHELIGFNYRMDGIQGAVLSVKLKYLQQWIDRRNEIAIQYNNGLKDIKELQLPAQRTNIVSAFHLYVVHTKHRDDLMEDLLKNGIASGLHYPLPIHLQVAYNHLMYKKGDFPIAELNAEQCLSLPMYPELTFQQVELVILTIRNYFSFND
jgi:dTDP-4-amino-4,6-dideoxygalactose transaminase